MKEVEHHKKIFLEGARFGYQHANTDHDLRKTLDEAEKHFDRIAAIERAPSRRQSETQGI